MGREAEVTLPPALTERAGALSPPHARSLQSTSDAEARALTATPLSAHPSTVQPCACSCVPCSALTPTPPHRCTSHLESPALAPEASSTPAPPQSRTPLRTPPRRADAVASPVEPPGARTPLGSPSAARSGAARPGSAALARGSPLGPHLGPSPRRDRPYVPEAPASARLELRPSNGVVEASDYLNHKHDWVQLEREVVGPFRRVAYTPKLAEGADVGSRTSTVKLPL